MTAPPTDAPRRQVALFHALFAISVVTDFRGWSGLEPDVEGVAAWLGVLAFAVALASGGSRVALLTAAAGGLVMLGVRTHFSNHQTLYLHLCLATLAVYAVRAISERRLRVALAPLHASLAAVARLGFVAFYFWVAFHKLNPQFLDPAWSCAVHLLELSARMAPVTAVPESFASLAGPLTLLLEMSVLVGLLVPRLRLAAVALGMAFHAALSFTVPTFQYLVFGYLLLFVPERVLDDAAARLRTLPGGGPESWLPTSAWGRVALGIAVVTAFEALARWSVLPGNIRILDHVTYRVATFLVLASLTSATVALVLPRLRMLPAADDRLLQALPAVLWLLPLAMFFQGAQPHLGIKAVQSFSMFSNLDTDAGQSNHLVLPASLQIADNLNDPVTVHRGSDWRLAAFTRRRPLEETILRAEHPPRMARPFLALQRHVTELARAGETGIRVEYTRGGTRRVVDNAENDPELAGGGLLVRRYLYTRPLALDNHGACRW